MALVYVGNVRSVFLLLSGASHLCAAPDCFFCGSEAPTRKRFPAPFYSMQNKLRVTLIQVPKKKNHSQQQGVELEGYS